jgi:hypothetical protein
MTYNDEALMKYDNEIINLVEPFNCSICLEDIYPCEIIQILNCNHSYHRSCIKKWKQVTPNQKAGCPICRNIIENSDPENISELSPLHLTITASHKKHYMNLLVVVCIILNMAVVCIITIIIEVPIIILNITDT